MFSISSCRRFQQRGRDVRSPAECKSKSFSDTSVSALTDWMRMKHRCRERFTNIKTSEHELHRIPCLGFEASVRITCEYLKLSRLVVIIHLEYSGVVIVCLDAFKTSQVK